MIFSNTLRNRLKEHNITHEKRFVTELTMFQRKEIQNREYSDEINSIYGYTFAVLGSTDYGKVINKGILSSPLEKDLENMTNLADALHQYYNQCTESEIRVVFDYTPKQQELINLAEGLPFDKEQQLDSENLAALLPHEKLEIGYQFDIDKLEKILTFKVIYSVTESSGKYGQRYLMVYVHGVPVGLLNRGYRWLGVYTFYPFNHHCLDYTAQIVLTHYEDDHDDTWPLYCFADDSRLNDPVWFNKILAGDTFPIIDDGY